MSTTYPGAFSHIGFRVPDLEVAVKLYTEKFGWYIIVEPTTIEEDDSVISIMCTDVFGPDWKSFRIAHLSTGDRVGVELFEFRKAELRKNNFEYWKGGVFHFCVQDSDVEGPAENIVAAGGEQRMPVREYCPGEKPFRMVYSEDPFGNILELYSHNYELDLLGRRVPVMTMLAGSQIVDLSAPISERLQANWPTHTRFQHKT